MLRKAMSILLCATMVLGTYTFQTNSYSSSSFSGNLSAPNDERLVDMLRKSGQIPAGATAEQIDGILKAYMQKKTANQKADEGTFASKATKRLKTFQDQMAYNSGTLNGLGVKNGHTGETAPNFVSEPYTGGVVEDKILAICIDFPDFPHNSIEPSETDLYYPDYSISHYTDMLFSSNGYKGPDGQTLISMKQFYEQQSGGSYSVSGKVVGWYTAKEKAAAYGGNINVDENGDGDDRDARKLVREALVAAANDPSIDLSEFDQEDRYDLDGDGNYREPDGLIDHLMIFHAAVGEEAGGGRIGKDAIWSHRWNLGAPLRLPNTSTPVPYFNNQLAAYDYTVQPGDAAAGVCSHEYGHDLGLPDEYDTQYSGAGEPISYWSVMSSGSWVGKIAGTEPVGFSPYAKLFFQSTLGGNWLSGTSVTLDQITQQGLTALLDQASTKGIQNDVVQIKLPDKIQQVTTPYAGAQMYFSDKGDDLHTAMSFNLDLTGKSSASLNFQTWYQIEEDYDYAVVKVNGNTIPGNLTTTTNPNGSNPGNGITGTSNGWQPAAFDLSAYAGQKVKVSIEYITDPGVAEPGFYLDNLEVRADNAVVFSDDAEKLNPAVTLSGFKLSSGTTATKHYYLLEWRAHTGVDAGLANIKRGDSFMSFDPGLLVWYVDTSYDNNWTGAHPGHGYLGIVDADQNTLKWQGEGVASTKYQMHDAAFSLQKPAKMVITYAANNLLLTDSQNQINNVFSDHVRYDNGKIPDAGMILPQYGLKIRVLSENADRSTAKIVIYK